MDSEYFSGRVSLRLKMGSYLDFPSAEGIIEHGDSARIIYGGEYLLPLEDLVSIPRFKFGTLNAHTRGKKTFRGGFAIQRVDLFGKKVYEETFSKEEYGLLKPYIAEWHELITMVDADPDHPLRRCLPKYVYAD